MGSRGAQSSLVDNQIQSEIPSPYCSFTAHTLTITDLVVGFGPFPLCRLMSSSHDSTVKVWDLNSRTILSTFLFPAPINCLAWERTERIFFASSQKGDVYRVNLYRKRQDHLQVSVMEAIGGGASLGEQIQIASLDGETTRLIPVGESPTCMSLSMNANHLLIGLETGLVHIYDVSSHQLLRTITNHKGQPIIKVGTIIKPSDLMGHVEFGETSVLKEDVPIRPLLPFQRVRDPRAREAHEVSVLLPQANIVPLRTQDELFAQVMSEYNSFTKEDESNDPSNALRDRVSELEAEVNRLRGQLSKAKTINDTMWDTLAKKITLPSAAVSDQEMISFEDDSGARKKVKL